MLAFDKVRSVKFEVEGAVYNMGGLAINKERLLFKRTKTVFTGR